MKIWFRRRVGLGLLIALAGCGQAPQGIDATTTSPTVSSGASLLTARDIMSIEQLAPLDPGTYFIDPDLDPSTPLRVVYEIPAEGWSQWIGAAKFNEEDGHVGVSIATVTNLVRDGCDSSWADPPIGPGVNDLATALADLAPFRVSSPPEDVSIYGYRGKYLELTVPDLPVEGEGNNLRFTGCIGGRLKSWVAPVDTTPGDAFYGYTGPGYTEEFWILDVEGARLMIAAERSPGSPQQDLAEQDEILRSIRIEP